MFLTDLRMWMAIKIGSRTLHAIDLGLMAGPANAIGQQGHQLRNRNRRPGARVNKLADVVYSDLRLRQRPAKASESRNR